MIDNQLTKLQQVSVGKIPNIENQKSINFSAISFLLKPIKVILSSFGVRVAKSLRNEFRTGSHPYRVGAERVPGEISRAMLFLVEKQKSPFLPNAKKTLIWTSQLQIARTK